MGGDDIEDYEKESIRNLLHANIDVHSRRFISEFPTDGIKCIEKLQSNCADMTFTEKVYMTGLFNKSHVKKRNMQRIKLKDSKMHMPYKFL